MESAVKRRLYLHQKHAYQFTGHTRHPALFMEMRLGKTLVTVRRLLAERLEPNLIVGPYCCLESWERELIAEGVPESEIGYLTGDRDSRLDVLTRRPAFCLINKEGWRVLPEVAEPTYQWRGMVADECTFLKAPPRVRWSETYGKRPSTSKWFADNFRYVKRRFGLTGTPAPESALDLYQQFEFIDPDVIGCGSYYRFRDKWFEKRRNHQYALTSEGQVFIEARLKQFAFTLKRSEVKMDVPKVHIRRLIPMPDKARAAYRTIEKEFLLEWEGRVLDSTIFATEKFIWLRRVCSGLHPKVGHVHRAKLDELLSLLTGELANDSVVVWAVFTDELNMVRAELESRRIDCAMINGEVHPRDRVDILRRFQAHSTRVLIAQPECFKYGVDLSASDTVIYFSTPLGLESRVQSEDRLVNIHTGAPVAVIDLLAEDTIEEEIYRTLLDKGDRQELIRRLISRWK